MNPCSQPRRGSALLVSSIAVITIAGLAISLTNLTIGRFGEQKRRQAQVDLLAASESAANETLNWLKVTPAVQTLLQNMALSTPGYPTATQSNSAVLVSSRLPTGVPAVFPALVGSGANTAGLRNGCTVVTKIIKVAASAVPSRWDNTERFIVYTTAQAGDETRPETIRRQRVETVLTAKSVTDSSTVPGFTPTQVPNPAFPFTRGMFSINGYNVSGSAQTDSWNSDPDGDGVHVAYSAATARSHGDIGSNGVLGAGAYDTSKVRGQATANAGATLPSVTYNPPTSGYIAMPTITGNTVIAGTSTGNTIYRVPAINHSNNKSLTISGTGTVIVYVDGGFNIGDINFATGSTAKLVIYQNNVTSPAPSFNSNNTIGDTKDPSRFLFVTAYSGIGSNEMKLNGGASFSGVVLAPNAGIKFNGNSHFYGSFVAKDFSGNVNGNYRFHYDEGLAGLSWGTIMTTINLPTATTVTTQRLEMLAPTAWHVRSVAYGSP